jgi:hypothetical protein
VTVRITEKPTIERSGNPLRQSFPSPNFRSGLLTLVMVGRLMSGEQSKT